MTCARGWSSRAAYQRCSRPRFSQGLECLPACLRRAVQLYRQVPGAVEPYRCRRCYLVTSYPVEDIRARLRRLALLVGENSPASSPPYRACFGIAIVSPHCRCQARARRHRPPRRRRAEVIPHTRPPATDDLLRYLASGSITSRLSSAARCLAATRACALSRLLPHQSSAAASQQSHHGRPSPARPHNALPALDGDA